MIWRQSVRLAFSRLATDEATLGRVTQLREVLPDGKIILGVDRMDYSKGIPLRLRAFNNALERFEELRGKITLIQISVPSRGDIPDYHNNDCDHRDLYGQVN